MTVYLPGEIDEAASTYRSATAAGRELSRTELDYFDEVLCPRSLDGDGRLDLSGCDYFTDDEVLYADLLVDLQGAGRRSLSEDEMTFAEVVQRSVYVRQIESDAIKREHIEADTIARKRADADAELDRRIQLSAMNWR